MKKSIILLIMCLSVALAACSNGKKEKKASGKNKLLEVTIEDANYIMTGNDDGVSENEDLAQIQVLLKVKNLSKSSMMLSSHNGITLYDGDEQLDSTFDVYNAKIGLEPEGSGDIGAGKTKKIPVIFNVEKDKIYEIGLLPLFNDINEKPKEVILALDTKEYTASYDALEEPAKALTAYIDTIYLAKENSDYEKYVTADKEAGQNKAENLFKELIERNIYKDISDEDAEKYYTSFKSLLGEKTELKTELVAYAGGKAVVILDYSTLSTKNISELLDGYKKEYAENKDEYDSDKETEYALSKFETIITNLEVKSTKRPIEVLLLQKDGKWTVDTSDYGSEFMEDAFAKGIIN